MPVRIVLEECLNEINIPVTQVFNQIQSSLHKTTENEEEYNSKKSKKLKKRNPTTSKDMILAQAVLQQTIEKILQEQMSPDNLHIGQLHNEIIDYRALQSLKRINSDIQTKEDLLELYYSLITGDKGENGINLEGGGMLVKGILADKDINNIKNILISCIDNNVPLNRIIEQINHSMSANLVTSVKKDPLEYMDRKYSSFVIAKREGGFNPKELQNDLETVAAILSSRHPDINIERKLQELQAEVMQRGFVEENDSDDPYFVLLKKLLYMNWMETVKKETRN